MFIVNFEKFSAVFPSHISFCSFSLLLYSHHVYVSLFNVTDLLDTLFSFFLLFPFCVSVRGSSYGQVSESLFPQPCRQYFSFFVHISSLFSHCVSAFPIRILRVLITVTSDPSPRIPEFLLCLFRRFFLAIHPACSFCRKVDMVSS